jgi:hypothetical protein
MDMSLYTLMFSIQIHVYYLIFDNELFVSNLSNINQHVM